MPRPRKPGAPSPKRRSRNGCWPCKTRKIKCDEERPVCENCSKASIPCDYSIRLNWEGRRGGKQPGPQSPEFQDESPGDHYETNTPIDGSGSSPSGLGSQSNSGQFSAWQLPGTEAEMGRPRKRSRVDAGATAATDTASPASTSSVANSITQPPPRPTSTGQYSRRLSVNSLLLGPPGPLENIGPIIPSFPAGENMLSIIQAGSDESYTCYGIDRGLVDLDVVKNDDFNAISRTPPHDIDEISRLLEDLRGPGDGVDAQRSQSQQHKSQDRGNHTVRGHYYTKPVVVRIPRKLEPLPSKLLGNPMNLMYFHHFLNHTAEVLVPFDGPQSNPFRTILPRLAVKNDHLLSLMLAYSASHRAKLLAQPEPATRIALWVQDIFPALRSALSDPNQSISNTNVATAIMLASVEIISPTAFGYAIPWQRHLALARDLITARPGGLRWSRSVDSSTAAAEHEEIQMCNFLWSWFAYIDVLGSLSGGGERSVSSAWILDYKVYAPEDDDEIDCLMGFSTGCVYILAKIAELARQQKQKQQQQQGSDTPESLMSPPLPDEETLQAAHELERDLARSIALTPRPCPHIAGTPDVAAWNPAELSAVNRAYHHAGSVHLQRRVLRRPAAHPHVRRPVADIVRCLDEIVKGGTAETSMLFPLFTAGCETDYEEQRRVVLDRMNCIARTGTVQTRRAIELMQRAWSTGQPWETLLTTEFIG